MPLFTALALAACSSPLPDEHIAEVEQAWVPARNNPACGAAACPAGQVVTCGNVCVVPVAIGGSCTQVDCQPTSVPSSSSPSFCAVGVEEGYACDSDWTSVYNSATNPKCAPCMPGTNCIGGYCHQPCITTLMGADCPCGNFGEVNKCYTNPASGAHDCYRTLRPRSLRR